MENKFFKGKLKYIKGNVAEPMPDKHRIVLNLVSETGILPVNSLMKKYAKIGSEYRLWYRGQNKFVVGNIQEIMLQSDLLGVNMLAIILNNPKDTAKKDLKEDDTLTNLESCFNKIATIAKDNSSSVHLSKILEGSWDKVEDLIEKCFLNKNINVFVYESK